MWLVQRLASIPAVLVKGDMKAIGSMEDLAVRGAPPAFSEPLHVGRPNIAGERTFMDLVQGMFARRWLTNNGPLVKQFEERVAAYLGVKHCIAMCNGTIALEIAIRAVGMTGEVIIPSYTFVATAHSLYWQGLTPVFADIDPVTHNLDPNAVRRMITPKTSGIIGVHLWGRAAPVEALESLAEEHGLALLFDAAHAFGCSHRGRMIGSFGRAEVLSFHATKFFNTFEGGAIVTDDDQVAETARLMRNFGFRDFDDVIHPGTNGKMVEVCAAMGLANLEAIDNVVESNRANYGKYKEVLETVPGISVLAFDEHQRHNYQYVVLEIASDFPVSRDEVVRILHAENILARKYFWPGCHKMKPYRDLFPHAELVLPSTRVVADRVIVLPTGTALPDGAIDVIGALLKVLSQGKA